MENTRTVVELDMQEVLRYNKVFGNLGKVEKVIDDGLGVVVRGTEVNIEVNEKYPKDIEVNVTSPCKYIDFLYLGLGDIYLHNGFYRLVEQGYVVNVAVCTDGLIRYKRKNNKVELTIEKGMASYGVIAATAKYAKALSIETPWCKNKEYWPNALALFGNGRGLLVREFNQENVFGDWDVVTSTGLSLRNILKVNGILKHKISTDWAENNSVILLINWSTREVRQVGYDLWRIDHANHKREAIEQYSKLLWKFDEGIDKNGRN